MSVGGEADPGLVSFADAHVVEDVLQERQDVGGVMVACDDDHGRDRAEAAQCLGRATHVVQARPGAVEEVAAVHDQVGGVLLGDGDDFVQDGVDLAVTSMAADLAAQVPVGGVEYASRHGCLQRNGLQGGAGCVAADGGSVTPTVPQITGRVWKSLELW